MAFFSKSLRNWTKKHDFIEGLRNGLPQNTQNSQNLLLSILPQNTQNAQNLLLSFFPTEYAELTEFTAEYSPTDFRCNFRGCTCLRSALPLARARSAPTKQTVILPQISQKYTDC